MLVSGGGVRISDVTKVGGMMSRRGGGGINVTRGYDVMGGINPLPFN